MILSLQINCEVFSDISGFMDFIESDKNINSSFVIFNLLRFDSL